MVKHYRLTNLSTFVDLSTYCNAACPQCHRTNPNSLEKADWLPLIQWSLKDFENKYPVEDLWRYFSFDICGTWGDPAMNKDIDKICKYILDNSNARIELSTNGSMRDEMWWYELGVSCGSRLNVIFTVDGINQEMHERYRQKTDLSKILSHMEAVSETKATASSITILFKHNYKYKEQIKELCRSHGAKSTHTKISDRFWDGTKTYFNNDEEYLEYAFAD